MTTSGTGACNKAAGVRLKALIGRGVERFVYDFGDDWRHDIFIESVRDGEADVDYPAFVDGERRCPPEERRRRPGLHGVSRGGARSAPRGAQRGVDLVRQALRPGRHRRMVGEAEARHAGCAPPGCPQAASTCNAARFDLTCGLRPAVGHR